MNVRTSVRAAGVCFVALALSASLGAAPPQKAAAGPTPIRVDGTIIKGYIDYMASDDKEGRRSLTPGYEKMAEWAAAQVQGVGPEAGGRQRDVPAGRAGRRAAAAASRGRRASRRCRWTAGRST